MICKKCGRQIADNITFCNYCGERVAAEPANNAPVNNAPVNRAPAGSGAPCVNPAPNYSAPQQSYQNNYAQVPAQPTFSQPINENTIPSKYKPLSAWAYFGYNLLFAIPLIGLICLIVFSLSNENINRRNYARSFWCIFVILFAIGLIFGVLALISGGAIFYDIENMFY